MIMSLQNKLPNSRRCPCILTPRGVKCAYFARKWQKYLFFPQYFPNFTHLMMRSSHIVAFKTEHYNIHSKMFRTAFLIEKKLFLSRYLSACYIYFSINLNRSMYDIYLDDLSKGFCSAIAF